MGTPQFCSTGEAAAKLGMTEDEVKGLVRDGKLREFRDRGDLFFKADEVDRLAEQLGQAAGMVTPDDSSAGGIALTDDAPSDAGVGASSAGDSAIGGSSLADSALGGSSLGDSAIGASHAGAAPTKKDDTSATEAEQDLAGDSSVGLSGTDLVLEPPGEEDTTKPDDEPQVGLSGSSALDLEDLGEADTSQSEDAKDDTVITSVGISVFDDDEIEIDADPLAKTRVTPSVEDQISLEGVGSGSGLLDLTRESDDTSLGAELLDEIYPGEEESTMQEDMPTEVVPGMVEGAVATSPGFVSAPGQGWAAVAVLPPDPAAAGFTGMMAVGVIVLGLSGTVLAAAVQGVVPSFLGTLYSQWLVLAGGGVGLSVGALAVGWLVGKQMAGPKASAPRAAAAPEAPADEDQKDEQKAEAT